MKRFKDKFKATLRSLKPKWFGRVRVDLRSSDHKRFGPFDPKGPRGTAAWWLRRVFGPQLRMRSTRDGKPV